MKESSSSNPSPLEKNVLQNKRVVFVGKLGALSRKEAMQLVRDHGANPIERLDDNVDIVVVGADELPAEDLSKLLSDSIRNGLRQGRTSLIHEHELWPLLGVVDELPTGLLYTPAMMAGLIKIPVRNIRRWFRMGLLKSSKVAHRLPYFDFIQVQNAKQLNNWIGRGASPADIRRQLTEFGARIENKSYAELDLVIDGKRMLLRQNGHLLSPNGQLHLDFDLDDATESSNVQQSSTLPFAKQESVNSVANSELQDMSQLSKEDMLHMAEELEDAGHLEQAIGWYRLILARFGLTAEVCFQLAELLYRNGDITAARERYYCAIELDEDFIEARANLGCVLAEVGQNELAIAAFQGALARDDHYPDVHYHLAKCLDESGATDEGARHWIRFLQLSPQSPWAEEALDRLGRL